MAAKTKIAAVKPRRKGALIAAAILGAVALTVGGWTLWCWRLVVSSLPPVVAASNSNLAEEIQLADKEARSFIHPIRGLVKISRLYHANGYYGESLQCYATLRKLQPRNPRWPHLEASLVALYGRMEDAIPREARAVELAPAYVPARLRLADEYRKAGRWQEARAAYDEVLSRAKDNPYALLGIALCDIQDNNWNAASDTLRRAIGANPEFIGAMSLMVTVYDHFGDTANAEALRQTIGRREFIDLEDPWLDELMDDCYDAYRISVVAAVQNFAGHTEIAKALLRRSIQLDPTAATYHRQYANLLFKEGTISEAKSEAEKAVQLNATDNDAWLLLYHVEQAMQDLPAAAATLSRALANCPTSASLHLERAHLMRSQGNMEAEAYELREAFVCDMRDGRPLEELALLYLRQNRIADAVISLKEALTRKPEDPHGIAMMTYCCIQAGDEREAIRWWTEHVLRQPKVPNDLKQTLQQAFQKQFGHALP